jgi:hypothetical protein
MEFVYEIPNNLSPEVCEDIIERFEKDGRLLPGVIGSGIVGPIKKSMDLGISPLPEWADIDKILFEKLKEGLSEYEKHIKKLSGSVPSVPLHDIGYQIQRTTQGEYYSWHHDDDMRYNRRIYTFLWYLNTLDQCDDGGATAFHPSIGGGGLIQPEQGKLLLFPATWTYVHMGLPIIKPETKKYVCTGWVCVNEKLWEPESPKFTQK